MQLIYNTFQWWYVTESLGSNNPNGFVISFYIAIVLASIAFLLGCLLGEFKGGENDLNIVTGLLAVILVSAVLCLILAAGGPVIIIALLVVGIGYGLEKIGDFFRNASKNKEDRGTKALAELINSDPKIKAQYEELMKQTPEI